MLKIFLFLRKSKNTSFFNYFMSLVNFGCQNSRNKNQN